MANIQQMISDLIEREGGYVNHKADRGGPTKYGITQKTLSDSRGYQVSEAEVRQLTTLEASSIYEKLYYLRPKIHMLPPEIQKQMFDFSVNSGPGTAIKMLQKILGVSTDGVIGPTTIRVAQTWVDKVGKASSNNAIAKAREEFFKGIVEKDPSQEVFLRGWLYRCNKFRTELA